MPLMIYILFVVAAFISFVFGALWMSRKIDNIETYGDIYVNGSDLYLDATPGLLTQPDGQYIILRVVRVTQNSREKQGL